MNILSYALIAVTIAFLAWHIPADTPTSLSRKKNATSTSPKSWLWPQLVVTLAILGVALYIILSHGYQPQDKHWAYGAAGTILGYWVRSK